MWKGAGDVAVFGLIMPNRAVIFLLSLLSGERVGVAFAEFCTKYQQESALPDTYYSLSHKVPSGC